MISIRKLTSEERKEKFSLYMKEKVKIASTYIRDLEKGFQEASIPGYSSIYEIYEPEFLEKPKVKKALKETPTFTRQSTGGTAGLAGLNWYKRFLKESRDSYYDFMNHFHIKEKDLFEWGLNAIIFPDKHEVKLEWENLKYRIFNNQEVSIRNYGRNGSKTHLFIEFYKYWLNNSNVKKDSSNNTKPKQMIEKTTGLIRNEDIYNYQISHIWGHTKNIFLFEAPWNICYMPKIMDPFTGHESKGDLYIEFQHQLQKEVRKKYKEFINDYNEIISSYDMASILDEYCKQYSVTDKNFLKNALNEFEPIKIDSPHEEE